MKRLIVLLAVLIVIAASPLSWAQTTSKPKLSGDLKNDPAREEEFMDWGLGMFVHWSFDSQLGSVRKEVLLKELKATPDTEIRVLGQEHRVEKFTSRHDIGTRFKQTEDGLEVSVKRAQRLYNNRRWPNAVVLRLENVEFIK